MRKKRKKGISFGKFVKILGEVKSELSKSIQIVIAGRPDVDKKSLLNKFILSEGEKTFLRFLDLDFKQPVEEILRNISRADIVLLLIDSEGNFDEREIALTVCAHELEKSLIVVVDGVVEEKREDFLKKAEKFLEVLSSDVVFISLADGISFNNLASKVLRELGNKEVLLGRTLPGLKEAAVDRLIRRTALANGLIGVITILPGSDMPILTANQIRMIIEIAAIYGVELNFERVREILTVISAGYVLRAVSRQLFSFLPLIGWVIKGGVACSGTILLGETAKKYFESGLGYLTNEDIKELYGKISETF